VILREQEEVDKQLEEVVFDHLHAVAYQGECQGLRARVIRGNNMHRSTPGTHHLGPQEEHLVHQTRRPC
jgi:hypothetical protein